MATVEHRGSHDVQRERIPGWLGTVLLCVPLVLLVLEGVDRTFGLPAGMPRSWYTNRMLWYAMGAAALGGGLWLLGQRGEEADWSPSKPGRRFHSVVFYTRDGCGLCDRALETLHKYRRWMPPVETVDIDSDPMLVERFGEKIPVVEIDGRARFSGRVEEFALRRLIDGTPPA